jgi:hypothetical protein
MTTQTPVARLSPSGDEILLEGPHYLEVFSELHRRLRPRTYLEIGTWKGSSLRIASCASLAVDRDFQLEEGVLGPKPICIFHQATSDEFFASQDPVSILGGPVDLAFIDALHVFEFALRDFIGTERSVRKSSIIVFDDPCPRDFYMARRTLVPEVELPTKYEGYWTGDVWKIVPVLREYRPDITLTCVDTLPTGLATCTNLNPDDRTLMTKYDEIVDRWRDVSLEDYGMARLIDDLQMESAEKWVRGIEPIYPNDPIPTDGKGTAGPTQAEIAHELRQELEATSRELEVMRRSRSWRLTRPLRSLAKAARKVTRRGGGSG